MRIEFTPGIGFATGVARVYAGGLFEELVAEFPTPFDWGPGTDLWVGVTAATGTQRAAFTLENSLVQAQGHCFEDGALQLADGTAESGRLEVFHGGQWGTVCDDDFAGVDAAVACDQLGFSGGTATHTTAVPDGTAPYWLDNVGCVGTEGRLDECPAQFWRSHNCIRANDEDVGVACTP